MPIVVKARLPEKLTADQKAKLEEKRTILQPFFNECKEMLRWLPSSKTKDVMDGYFGDEESVMAVVKDILDRQHVRFFILHDGFYIDHITDEMVKHLESAVHELTGFAVRFETDNI